MAIARSRKRAAAAPPTVSRRSLLVNGSDAQFRSLIHDLIAYGHRLDACRDAFSQIVGVSGAQYEILMLVSRAEGLSVGEVAARLHRSGAFITIESNRLVARGILEKAADPEDGRRMLLRPNAKSRQLLQALAPTQRRINDILFACLDAKRFRTLRRLARDLVDCGDRAMAQIEALDIPQRDAARAA
jgi:DNA-binding MarR family transcriptional regulator